MSFEDEPPGSPGNPLPVSDPQMLRALAHPVRIAILQHLALDGPATATECAQVVGLSPSACSYHLRALARRGFVEEDRDQAPDGRQRPWRARISSLSFTDEPGDPAAKLIAGRLLTESFTVRFDELRAEYLDRQTRYSAAWRAAAGLSQYILHLTAAELAELREQLNGLITQYNRFDPADRPAGARRVNLALDIVPWFEPDGADGADRETAADGQADADSEPAADGGSTGDGGPDADGEAAADAAKARGAREAGAS